jgi:hypothetical protein
MLMRAAPFAMLLVLCGAHIGSPDAWYEGPAGPYHVLVHVETPTVVPGIATVNVRVNDPDVREVNAFVNKFDATGGAPPPDVAVPMANNPGWYRTRLWVMSPGSNSVTVTVRGVKGTGTVVVPLTAVASRRLTFNAPLVAILVAAFAVLAAGLFSIVGAAVRESVLPPGALPDITRRRRARRSMARSGAVIVLVVLGTAAWWRAEDAAFTRNLYRPLPIGARIDPTSRELSFSITDSAWAHRHEQRGRPQQLTNGLVDDHGKLVHLFVISLDRTSNFAHLHPRTSDSTTFTTTLPPLPAGEYSVLADIVQTSGFTQTLETTVTVPAEMAPFGTRAMPDTDDTWSTSKRATGDTTMLEDGTRLTWVHGPAPLVAGNEASLRFSATPPAGEPLALQTYLGMMGHMVILRTDGKVFIHLHPIGTISTAAQAQLMRTGAPGGMNHMMMSMPETPGDTLEFPYAFPEAGDYTVWVQLKRRGKVLTGTFAATVLPAARPTHE